MTINQRLIVHILPDWSNLYLKVDTKMDIVSRFRIGMMEEVRLRVSRMLTDSHVPTNLVEHLLQALLEAEIEIQKLKAGI